jgi:hypothetical protein
MEPTSNQLPPEAVNAWYQLMQLNLTSHQPQFMEWLHSENADPVLKQLLVNVPCAGAVH